MPLLPCARRPRSVIIFEPRRNHAALSRLSKTTSPLSKEARFEPDVWERTILQVAIGALEYEAERPLMPKNEDEPQPARGTLINRLSPKDQQRIAAVLTHLKWEPKHNNRERWWQPK